MPTTVYEPTNDPAVSAELRLDALQTLLASGDTAAAFPDFVAETNNHIHTCFSFSPYTPTHAALCARRAGLPVVGSVDHDSVGAAAEMQAATAALGMGCVTGFEVRALFDPAPAAAYLTQVKLNNPDSVGVAYLTVQGIPAPARLEADKWLAPLRQARLERTLKMAERANEILTGLGLEPFDPQADMVGISQFHRGGGITERHLLAAMARALIKGFGTGPDLVAGLEKLGLQISPKLAQPLGDRENPHLLYDLLGLLKAEYLDRIYIQPTGRAQGGELPAASEVVAFADSIGALAAYAYLGDVAESPTGDKKAEKFEDDFLDELFASLADLGFRAVTYMPPRNTRPQIERVHALAQRFGMLEISGVDINQSRQSFACPELREEAFAPLNEATWALVAHETLSSLDPALHLLGARGRSGVRLDPPALAARIARYAPLGRQLAAGADPAKLAAELATELAAQ